MSSNLKGWEKLLRWAKSSPGYVKVGITGPNAKAPTADGKMTMAELGAVHEFGSPKQNIPQRSFVRATVELKEKEIFQLQKKLYKRLMFDDLRYNSKIDESQALGLLGSWLSTEMKKRITEGEGIPPANSPKTIEKKKSSRPLVDTGRMLNSITWVVEKGSK